MKIRSLSEMVPGDVAAMITGEAEGAIPVGSRIVKTFSDAGDSTPLGGEGTVLASHRFTAEMLADMDPQPKVVPDYLYFVAWDHTPNIPVAVSDFKIGRA